MGQYEESWRAVHNFISAPWMQGMLTLREALAKAKDAEAFVEHQVAEIEARRTALAADVAALEDRLGGLKAAEVAAVAEADQRARDTEARLTRLDQQRTAEIEAKAAREHARIDAAIADRASALTLLDRELDDRRREIAVEMTTLANAKRNVARVTASLDTLRAERHKLATAALEDD